MNLRKIAREIRKVAQLRRDTKVNQLGLPGSIMNTLRKFRMANSFAYKDSMSGKNPLNLQYLKRKVDQASTKMDSVGAIYGKLGEDWFLAISTSLSGWDFYDAGKTSSPRLRNVTLQQGIRRYDDQPYELWFLEKPKEKEVAEESYLLNGKFVTKEEYDEYYGKGPKINRSNPAKKTAIQLLKDLQIIERKGLAKVKNLPTTYKDFDLDVIDMSEMGGEGFEYQITLQWESREDWITGEKILKGLRYDILDDAEDETSYVIVEEYRYNYKGKSN